VTAMSTRIPSEQANPKGDLSMSNLATRSTFFVKCRAYVCAIALAVFGVLIAAPGASAAECPNKTLREESNLNPLTHVPFSTELPACRAYEQVTPSFKGGLYPEAVQQYSASGNSIIVRSEGVFAAAKGNDLGTYYRLTRNPVAGRWEPEWVGAPSSLFNAENFDTASADGSSALWSLRPHSAPYWTEDLVVREPDGAFAPAGPMIPPARHETASPPSGNDKSLPGIYRFAGASEDLQHVFFLVQNSFGGEFWPGDTTITNEGGGRGSLYEYKGRENTVPTLVGLDDTNHLISDCSTYLGGPGGQLDAYNAVSANGAVIYFSSMSDADGHCSSAVDAPEVTELFARVEGTETVPISEPATSQCLECTESPKMSAEFQGASHDGRQVYFLTEQELLPGFSTKNLYGYDFSNPAGHRIVRVSSGSTTPEVQGVVRVSQDGSHVYFVAKSVLTSVPNGVGASAQPGQDNFYVYARQPGSSSAQIKFVATLSEGDSELWDSYDQRPAQATPDGHFIAFESRASLIPGDSNTADQVFEFDSQTGELVRLSKGGPSFPKGTENADVLPSGLGAPAFWGSNNQPTALQRSLAISDDGSVVVFSSRAALVPEGEVAQEAKVESAYEYRSQGAINDGGVSLLSPADTTLGTGLLSMTPSGSDVFLRTSQALTPSDGDVQVDIYDARLEGGLPAPAVPLHCEGDACQGSPTPLLAPPQPGTSNFRGPTNPLPKHRKAHRHKRHRHQRKAAPQHRRDSSKTRGGEVR
jgi:hypothetical protein